MSNCDVGSGGFGLPGDVVAQHGVKGCDHLAHDSDDDDFGLFVGGGETTVEDFESGIVSASAQSGHVEHISDWQPTAVDAAMSFEPTAVEVIRGETDGAPYTMQCLLLANKEVGREKPREID